MTICQQKNIEKNNDFIDFSKKVKLKKLFSVDRILILYCNKLCNFNNPHFFTKFVREFVHMLNFFVTFSPK